MTLPTTTEREPIDWLEHPPACPHCGASDFRIVNKELCTSRVDVAYDAKLINVNPVKNGWSHREDSCDVDQSEFDSLWCNACDALLTKDPNDPIVEAVTDIGMNPHTTYL